MGESPEAMHYDEDRVRALPCTANVRSYTDSAEDFLSPRVLHRYSRERCGQRLGKLLSLPQRPRKVSPPFSHLGV